MVQLLFIELLPRYPVQRCVTVKELLLSEENSPTDITNVMCCTSEEGHLVQPRGGGPETFQETTLETHLNRGMEGT